MGANLKADWKALKKLLADQRVQIPKISKSDRIKLYFGHMTTIAGLFDKIDKAFDAGELENAEKAFKELKPKVEAFLKSAEELQKDIGVATPEAKKASTTLKNVINDIKGLVLVARAEVVALKEAAGREGVQLDAKKVAEWEKKLDEMNTIITKNLGILGNVGVTMDGLKSEANKIREKVILASNQLRSGDNAAAQTLATARRDYDIRRGEFDGRVTDFGRVRASLEKQLPALKVYITRSGMEALHGKQAYTEATNLLNGAAADLDARAEEIRDMKVLFDKLETGLKRVEAQL